MLAHRIHTPDGGREQLAKTVAALRRPASYPGSVARVDAIETHMSWVFLTESRAYKLKKPLVTDLIDHSTIAARRRACATELELNRRLAGSVYLALTPVTRSNDQLRVGGAGEVIDWLVEMRRLLDQRMLDARIRDAAVTGQEIDSLGDVLADFFAGAAQIGLAAGEYRGRIAADLAAKRSSLAQPHYGLKSKLIDAVYAAQQDWLAVHARALEARALRVVDGHGDLRPEHVCLEQPPVVIDCLEFAEQLRWLDPVSELGFLGLECRLLSAAWIGERLLDRYVQATGDRPPVGLVEFYQSHHAVIRAAISVWHLDDHALDHSERWRVRAHEYLELASELLTSTPRDRRS